MQEVIIKLNDTITHINQQIAQLELDKEALEKTKSALYRLNDICPDCSGKGYYYRNSDGQDPYEKTSDLREPCKRCSGSGNYLPRMSKEKL